MRFGTSNVKSLYRAGLPKTESRELAKYKLYLVAEQEVGLRVVVSQQTIVYFSMQMEKLIIT